MRIFVTGATGFVGSAVVRELIDAGHQVLGLARSETSAKALAAAGAEVQRGALEDLESLPQRSCQSRWCDPHGLHSRLLEIRRELRDRPPRHWALGSALEGSQRPLLVTSGAAMLAPGRTATENDTPPPDPATYPRASEVAAAALVTRGLCVGVVRLPPSVHGDGDHGFVPILINFSREKGVSAYVGDGQNRWPAVHRLNAARVYKLALEKCSAGARYHAVAEEGVPFREIAEVIGRLLNVPVVSKTPEDAAKHFGWFTRFAAADAPASSAITRERLGWRPKQPGLIADIDRPRYFQS